MFEANILLNNLLIMFALHENIFRKVEYKLIPPCKWWKLFIEQPVYQYTL
jgi:hypothetical protein